MPELSYPPAMRTALAALALVVVAGGALARDDAAVSPHQLIANPTKYKGTIVVVRRIRCVDPGAAGFICEATPDNGRLRLDASVLGASTKPATAEKLIGPCKGRSALLRPTCTFDVVLEPTGQGIEDGVTVIYARDIDMSTPRRP